LSSLRRRVLWSPCSLGLLGIDSDEPTAKATAWRTGRRSLEDVFDHVTLFAPDSYIDGSGGGNYVLVGSDSPIDLAAIESEHSPAGANHV
jgi:hypothetical protein